MKKLPMAKSLSVVRSVRRNVPLRSALIYALIATVAAVAVDGLLINAGIEAQTLVQLGILKYVVVVALTAVLLYGLIRRNLAAIEEAESHYRELVDNAVDIVYTLDLDFRFTAIGRAVERVLGYTPDELIGTRVFDLAPGQRETVIEMRDLKLRGEPRTTYEIHATTRDGRPVILEINSRIAYQHGQPVSIHGIARDVTERRRVEAALEHERKLLQLLLDNTADTIYFKDTASRFTQINRAQAGVLGVADAAQAIGKTDADFFVPDLARQQMEKERRIVETGRPELNLEEYNPAPDGKPRWFSVSKYPIFDKTGKVAGLFGISRDITATKLREREFEVIATVAAAVRSAATQEEMLSIVLDQIATLLHVDGSAIGLCDALTGDIIIEAANGSWAKALGLRIPGSQSVSGEVMRTGQPYLSVDMQTDPHVYEVARLLGNSRGFAMMPLATQGQTLGVLAVGRMTPIPDGEPRLLVTVGDIAASALQRLRVTEQAQRRAEQLAAVNTLGRALNQLLDLPQIYQQLTTIITQLLPDVATTLISTLDSTQQLIACVHGVSDGQPVDVTQLPSLAPGAGGQDEALRTRQPVVIRDLLAQHERSMLSVGANGRRLRSAVYAPMVAKNNVIGLLQVQSYIPNRFGHEEAELLSLIANTAAVSIQNARLFEAERKQRERAEALARMAARLNAQTSLDLVLAAICEEAANALHVPAASIYLFNPERDELIFGAGIGLPDDFGVRARSMPRAVYDALIESGKATVVIPNIQQLSDLPAASLYIECNICTVVGVGMLRNDQLVGMLNVKSLGEVRNVTDDELDLLRALANQAAIAIQNAQLLEAEREQRTLAEALRDSAAALNSTLNFDEVLDRMLDNIGRVVPHDAANIMLIDDAQDVAHVVRRHGYDRISPEIDAAVRQLKFPVCEVPDLHQMMETGQPFIIADTQRYTGWVTSPATRWQRAYLGAPIYMRDRLVGFIGLDSATPDFYTPAHADRLRTFANQAAIAIQNAHLFEAEREQRTLSEALRDIAVILNSTLDVDEVFNRVLSTVSWVVPSDLAAILQIEEGIGRITRIFGELPPQEQAALQGWRFPIETASNLRRVVETRQAVAVADVRENPGWTSMPDFHWTRSFVAAPIPIKGNIASILLLYSAIPHFYTPMQAERLQILTAQAAAAIENAQLFAETQQQVRELAALFDSSLAITASLDRATVLRTITERLANAVDATSVYVITCDWEQDLATVVAEYLSPQANELERISDLETTHSLRDFPQALAALRAGQPSTAKLSQRDADPAAIEDLKAYGGKSSLRVPLIVAGEVRGYAVLWDSRTERTWTQAEMRLCQTLANQAAVALENVRLFEATQRRLTQQSALLAASLAVSSSLDLLTVLQRLAEQIGRVIDATSVYVCEWDQQANTAKVVVDYYGPAACEQERVSDMGEVYELTEDFGSEYAWVREGESTVQHVDDPELPEQRRRHLLHYGGQSVLAVGLIAKSTVYGYIEAWESRQRREFGPDEIALCQGIAQQAAIAYENARLFEAERKQLRLAQTLQAVGALLTSEMTLNEVYEYLFDLLARVIRYDSVSVQLLDGEEMQFVAGRGFANVARAHEIVKSISRQTLEERWHQPYRRVIVISNTDGDPHWHIVPGAEHIRSWMGAALRVKGRLLGILNVDSVIANEYEETVAETVAAFANQAAIAIENAQLNEAVRRHTQELEIRVVARTAELERERQRTAAILDTAGEGIFLTDVDGAIEYVNPAMERLTGYQAAELLDKNPRVWQSGQTSPALYHELWDTIKRGRIWQGELVNRHKDGQLYDAALTVAPLRDADGKIAGFVGVQHNITQQKELNRLKDEFVSNVSHELRTPIANVKLYLSLLTRGKPEKRDEYLQTLRRESARLEKLIEDLLDLSRLDMGTTRLEIAPTDLNQLTAQLIADRSALAANRRLTIDYQAEPGLVLALVDQAPLVQVVSNLLTNAINYTQPGGSILVTVARVQQDEQRWATITVKDTGPGISAIDLPHLFERFYRGEVGRKSGAPGTGLGLAISHKIVARMNGQITVESRPGYGAAFTVWLPLV
jgi:PAS domain S-box-containing protein